MSLRDDLLEAVKLEVRRQLQDAREITFAEVTSTSPLEVRFWGDDPLSPGVPIDAVDGYTPTLGATAVVLRVGTARWAIAEKV